jgi:hypothetical protein
MPSARRRTSSCIIRKAQNRRRPVCCADIFFFDGATGASDALRGIAVGEGGTILRTPNGGQGGPPDITLSVNAYKFRGNYYADLTWTETTSSQMDIYRNGALIVTTENDGNYTDALRKQRKGTTFVYKVREAGTQVCSNEATVVIRAH